MTDTTAALYGVTACDDRIFSLREGRRLIRLLSDGIIIGVGAGAAVCALVWSVTWAALWITSTALAIHPNLGDKAMMGPAAIALADPNFAFASAADFTGSAEVAGDPADAKTFQDK